LSLIVALRSSVNAEPSPSPVMPNKASFSY
jgi:hypothetical protein